MKQALTNRANILDDAALRAHPVAQTSFGESIILEDAYAVQADSIRRREERGEAINGIKLGFTSKVKMKEMGVKDIIWGRLTDKMQIMNSSDLHIENYILPRAEPEIAFKLGTDIKGLTTIDDAIKSLSGVAVAIEIIDSRYKNFKFSLEDIVADNCFATGYVIGDWKEPHSKVDDLKMEMSSNTEVVESGNSNAILGNPLKSLIEAARLADHFGFQLKKDMIILAGAATSSVLLKRGDRVEVTAGHLGQVNFTVD